MALTMLLTFFLGLLHLLAGVCNASDFDNDLLDLQTFIYKNLYPVAKPSNAWVILTLANKGQCMSYIGLQETTLESLASCELYCSDPGTFYANTWDCIAPAIDHSNPDWNNTFTDQSLLIWVPGTCSCTNSTNPTPSGQSDDYYTPAELLQGVVKAATKETQELTTYNYQTTPGYTDDFIDHLIEWDFTLIDWNSAPGQTTKIGVFGVMNNGVNNNVLRVHEIWSGRDTRSYSQRARFGDDVMSFWNCQPCNRLLNDLKEVRFDTVIEDSINEIIEWIYEMMGVGIMQPLLVQRNGLRPNEAEVFGYILQRAVFARSLQRAIRTYAEFAHRRIDAFYFTCGVGGFDHAIYFDGYNLNTVGDATWVW